MAEKANGVAHIRINMYRKATPCQSGNARKRLPNAPHKSSLFEFCMLAYVEPMTGQRGRPIDDDTDHVTHGLR